MRSGLHFTPIGIPTVSYLNTENIDMAKGITDPNTARAATATKRAATLRLTSTAEPLWSDALADFNAHMKATSEQNTSDTYAALLSVLIAWAEGEGLTLVDFRARNLDQYLGWRKEQPSKVDPSRTIADSTRRKDAIAARLLFRFCFKRGMLDVDILKDYTIPRGNQTLTPVPTEAEIRRLLASIRRHWDPERNPIAKYTPPQRRAFYEARNVAVIVGLAQTGARIGELLGLRLDDFRPRDLVVIFRDTKTNVDREVPIKPEWVEIVNTYLKVRPKIAKASTLFVNDYGEEIGTRDFALTLRRMKEYCDQCTRCSGTGYADTQGRAMLTKAGRRHRLPTPNTPICAACAGSGKVSNPLGKWSLHGLRHYAITKLCEHGIDVAQRIAGHQSISTTMIYNHVHKDRVRAAFDAADLLPLNDPDDPPIMVNKRSQKNKKRRLV